MRCDHMLPLVQNHRDARQALFIQSSNGSEPCTHTMRMLMVKAYQEQPHRVVWLK
jgi:hypothetical protein